MLFQRQSPLHRKGQQGYSLAELPAGMIFLFVGVAIPLIILASVTYRATLLYFAVRDSCIRAAKAPTWSEGVLRGTNAFNKTVSTFTEISGTPQIRILIKPINGSPSSTVSGPLARSSIDPSNNLYFITESVNGTVSPLIAMGSYFGLQIPGLTAPFGLRLRFEALVENTDGLTE